MAMKAPDYYGHEWSEKCRTTRRATTGMGDAEQTEERKEPTDPGGHKGVDVEEPDTLFGIEQPGW